MRLEIASRRHNLLQSSFREEGVSAMFISQAWAQGSATQGGGIESMLLIVLMFGVLYFMMIRPQMKRAKEHKVMLEALQKGDEVVSGGGILGRISKISDSYITLEVAQGVEMVLQRSAIQVVLPKGTIKNI